MVQPRQIKPQHLTYKEAQMPSKTIMVVEDEEALLTLLKSILRKYGELILVTTCTEGWKHFQDHQDEIDLVVTDLNTGGGLHGLAMAEMIRERRPEVPIILCCTDFDGKITTDKGEITDVAKATFTEIIAKPFPLKTLQGAVKKALGLPEDIERGD